MSPRRSSHGCRPVRASMNTTGRPMYQSPADDLREVILASLATVPRLFPFECLGEFFLCPVPFLL